MSNEKKWLTIRIKYERRTLSKPDMKAVEIHVSCVDLDAYFELFQAMAVVRFSS